MTSHSLPERPDLDQLRRQAKELRDAARAGEPGARARLAAYDLAAAPVTLAAAQLAIAREHGASSWAQLRATIEERLMDRAQRVRAFLVSSVTGHGDRAARLLRADPTLAADNIWTAAVLGEAGLVRRLVARDPALAVEPDAESGWPPLLAVCNSRWHQLAPARSGEAIDGGNAKEIAAALPATVSTIDKAVQKGVLHSKAAARHKSRLTARVNQASAK